VYAAILDPVRGGRFAIRPEGRLPLCPPLCRADRHLGDHV
jgi:hypothetical protein